jgi:ABC-2 type transport system ATP-binding protein
MAIVALRGVSKSFRGTELFRGVDLDVEPGTTTAVTGPNGAGKSVLLMLMCGFAQPTTGSIEIDARYLSEGRTFPERFGVCINGPAVLPGLSAEDNLLRLAAIRGEVGRTEVRATLARVGLHAGRKRARTFSLGMRQRLSLAQALLERPAVLLLDEPFNALDADGVELVRSILREDRARGTAIVFTSHQPADVEALADRVFEFRGGTLVERADRAERG